MAYIRSTVSPEALDISDNGQNVYIHSGVTNTGFSINSQLFKEAILSAKKCIKSNKAIDISFHELSLKETWIDTRNNQEVDIDNFSIKELIVEIESNCKEVVRLSYKGNYIDMYLSTLYYIVFANFK